MPKVTKIRKTKKLTYKQMMNDILKPKTETTNTENKTPSGLGGGTFEKVFQNGVPTNPECTSMTLKHGSLFVLDKAALSKAKKKRKNKKHASIIPDIIEERRKSSSTDEIKIYKYKKGKYLGKGGFARCYTMTNMEDGHVYAGKVVSKSSLVKSTAKELLIAEIKIHKHLNHRHIVKFEHFFEDKVNVYLLLELCTNNTMEELVKNRNKLSEPEARYYTLQTYSYII